jgi:pSer/pThr/pTyr-binding forkhead associated (FHA) protein
MKKLCNGCGTINETNVFECKSCFQTAGLLIIDVDAREPETAPLMVTSLPQVTVLYLNFPPPLGGCIQLDSHQTYLGIGRDPDFSQVAAQCESYLRISKKHAEINFVDGKFILCDLGSRNGTFADGMQIQPGKPIALKHAMVLRFSNAMEVSVVVQGG